MIILEIVMVIVGLAAVFYSYKMTEEKGDGKSEKRQPLEHASNSIRQDQEEYLRDAFERLQIKATEQFDELDEKVSKLSNDKIMGMNEYSDQVLEQIEKNHSEVVFMYNMMNEKKEEIQQLVSDVDSQKAEIHDEIAKVSQDFQEQEEKLRNLKKDLDVELLSMERQKDSMRMEANKISEDFAKDLQAFHSVDSDFKLSDKKESEDIESEIDAFLQNSMGDSDLQDADIDFQDFIKQNTDNVGTLSDKTSLYDAEIARIEEAEKKELDRPQEDAAASFDLDKENHNEEVLSLYKKGYSIIDISKMLSLGQGEVKFIIDLYNAR